MFRLRSCGGGFKMIVNGWETPLTSSFPLCERTYVPKERGSNQLERNQGTYIVRSTLGRPYLGSQTLM